MIRGRAFLLATALATLMVAGADPASAIVTPGPPGAVTVPVGFAKVERPSRLFGSWSARLVAPTRVTARPGKGRTTSWLRTWTSWSHGPQSLLVLDTHEDRNGRQWLKVLLPIRPSGSTGWIPRNKATLRQSDLWIEIRKRNRWLVAFKDGKPLRRFRVVIGDRSTPTPAGLAAIYERNRQPDPDDFLGPWALPITALSPTLMNYGGGPGRIAIHGRGGESFRDPLGSAASHGCIRIPNGGVRWLARHAHPGTPVVVRNR